MSEFIDNLNMAPPSQELLPDADFNTLEADLAIWTNTQFFDFDMGQDANLQPTSFERSSAASTAAELKQPLDFDIHHGSEFTFSDYNAFSQQPNNNAFVDGILPLAHHNPLQTDVAGGPYPSSPTTTSSLSGLLSPQVGEKRKLDSSSSAAFEDASRLAAEEDKRRRNTAASARFRIKKKQREQALEQSAKQMSDKMSALEAQITRLEMENKWLKNLITEKNEKKDDIEALYKKFSKDTTERKSTDGKDGVGTEA